MTQIVDNVQNIRVRIEKAAQAAGRRGADISLMAVSKTQSDENINAAFSAGIRLFGENRVQEARARWTHRRAIHTDVKVHLIGPLQTNKVKEAVALFDCIETLDREKLAAALAQEMKKQGRAIPCFIQVNTGKEPQKAGVFPEDAPALYHFCKGQGIDVTGLMCIPPEQEDPAMHFMLLAALGKKIGIDRLSMGMSHDFETAIRHGATQVRIGSALFGARE
jgi:pyridoxal phosphate enzyme (YggS family)